MLPRHCPLSGLRCNHSYQYEAMCRFSLVVVVIVFLCVTEDVLCNDVKDFFKSIPIEIEKALSSTWESVKTAVKKPVRVRRVGSARRKTTTTTTTTTTMTTTTTEMVFKQSSFNSQIKPRIQLPVLFTPEWRGVDHWIKLQMPDYSLMKVAAFNSRRRMLNKLAQHYTDSYHDPVPPADQTSLPERTSSTPGNTFQPTLYTQRLYYF